MARSACDLIEAGYKYTGQYYKVIKKGFCKVTVYNYFGNIKLKFFLTEKRSFSGAKDLLRVVYLHYSFK